MMLRVASECTGIDDTRRARNAAAGLRDGRDEAGYYRSRGADVLGCRRKSSKAVGIVDHRRDIAPRSPFSDLIHQAFSAHQARERGWLPGFCRSLP
jgi:hypothetical protein